MPASPTFVGLYAGNLYLSSSSADYPLVITRGATSVTITPAYVVCTLTNHEAHFIPTSILHQSQNLLVSEAEELLASTVATAEKRRVERGSRIVVAVPSSMNLVLQMPRGNLETIAPRPFVLDVVKANVARYIPDGLSSCFVLISDLIIYSRQYRNAFLACRKHRIDLDIVVSLGFETFMAGLEQFIQEVPEVDHINLFLANVGCVSQYRALCWPDLTSFIDVPRYRRIR